MKNKVKEIDDVLSLTLFKEIDTVLSIILNSDEKIILKPKIFPSRVKNHSEKRIELCPCHNPSEVKPKLKSEDQK